MLKILTAAALLVSTPALAQSRSAAETYLTYLDVCGSLTSLSELKPYVPKAMGDMLTRIPKDVQAQMVQQSRKKSVTRVKVLGETKMGDATILDLEGHRGDKTVRGWARMVVEDGQFKVAKDDWNGTPAPAPPKIPGSVGSGKAAGEMTVDGKTVKLQYAWAREVPDAGNPVRKSYEVRLSDAPWDPKDPDPSGRVRAGKLHYVELAISADKRAAGATLHDAVFDPEGIRAVQGLPILEVERLGPDVVSGKAYLETFEESRGQAYYFAATFKAPVEKSAPDGK
ncbi:MAG TPA: hypothetical protein VKH43_11205 [Thermoanaerobaculia bacterium]|nr:hypothetical protein [Thermoanaerobaculia bacterium]